MTGYFDTQVDDYRLSIKPEAGYHLAKTYVLLFSGLDTHCTWLSQRPDKGNLVQPSGNALGKRMHQENTCALIRAA